MFSSEEKQITVSLLPKITKIPMESYIIIENYLLIFFKKIKQTKCIEVFIKEPTIKTSQKNFRSQIIRNFRTAQLFFRKNTCIVKQVYSKIFRKNLILDGDLYKL
jgi:hypothetical protein